MSSPESLALSPATTRFATDVAEYLQRAPRQLPSRYLYDALGSALFDAICRLPWYRVTRAETALLARRGARILDGLRRPLSIAELGCGNGEKLATLLDRAGAAVRRVHLIDISPTALLNAKHRLTGLPDAFVTTFQGTYEDGLAGLVHGRSHGAWVVLFLGSNIGNFDPPAAAEFLRRIRGSLEPGDALLLGTDLVKPVHELMLAYDDPLEVTAAFNKNLLRRINDELGGTFDLDGFRHRAVWNSSAQRVEMHLVSTRRQVVRIAAIDLQMTFEADEWIWTESSYKFDADIVVAEGAAAGFGSAVQWIDHDAQFALTRFTV